MAHPRDLTFARAEQALRQGDGTRAAALASAVLADGPHAGAHHLLGLIAAEADDLATAERHFRTAAALAPGSAGSHNNLGNVLRRLGREQDALDCYRVALAQDPGFSPARYNQARVLEALGRLDEALESYRLLRDTASDARLALAEQGRLLVRLTRYQEALGPLDEALAADPAMPEPWANKGAALHGLGRQQDALACYDRAIELAPGVARLACNKGTALYELKRPADAMVCYQNAVAIDPCHADSISNMGNALMMLQRPEEALAWYDRALLLQPGLNASLSSNRANALAELGRTREALEAFAASLATDPDYAVARNNEGLLRLLLGDFAAGWAGTASRWLANGRPLPAGAFPQPIWDGSQPIDGKRVLITAEQGLGDVIQFCRYATLLAERGAVVLLQVPSGLVRLLRGLAHVDMIVAPGAPVPAFDLHCPLLELPAVFRTTLATIPGGPPYLRAPRHAVTRWDRRLGRSGVPRIGLVWTGNPQHNTDYKRSVPLPLLLPLLRDVDAERPWHFVCLQKLLSDPDRQILAGLPQVTIIGDEIEDFADTAAIVETLDLVISVDTSVAHLAGALGRPVWVLLPMMPDWRWLLDRSDSPWYSSARLFRQRRIGDWPGVIEDVAAALQERRMVQGPR